MRRILLWLVRGIFVIEIRELIGVAEEFCPGVHNSIEAFTVSLLNPRVIEELQWAPMASKSWTVRRTISCRSMTARIL